MRVAFTQVGACLNTAASQSLCRKLMQEVRPTYIDEALEFLPPVVRQHCGDACNAAHQVLTLIRLPSWGAAPLIRSHSRRRWPYSMDSICVMLGRDHRSPSASAFAMALENVSSTGGFTCAKNKAS